MKNKSKKNSREDYSEQKQSGFIERKRGALAAAFTLFRILVFAALLILFFHDPAWYSKVSSGVTHYMKKRIVLITGLSFLMVILPCFRLRLHAVLRVLINLCLIPVTLAAALYLAEYVHGFNIMEMDHKFILLNFILAFAIFLAFHVIADNIKISLFLAFCLITGFSVLNYFVNIFRGEAINAQDIFVAGTALNVASSYAFTLSYEVFAVIFAGMVILCFFTVFPPEKLNPKGIVRLFYDAAAIAAVVFTFWVFIVTEWPYSQGVKVKVFEPMRTYKINGQVLNFVRSFYYIIVKAPDGYSAKAAKELMDKSGYVSDAPDAGEKKPNVIFILNESLTDYSDYPVLELTDDPLKFIHSLADSDADNVITGHLNVDVFGGSTANSEYEVLTGNTTAFLPYKAVPFALFVRDLTPSINWNMRDMGYCGVNAFHPYKANGYSRPRAYPNLGFTDFISLETISDSLTPEDYLRGFVSDRADYRIITELYEKARAESDAPFYLYNATMQNHGGYTADFDNFEQTISITGELEKVTDAKRFINLMKYSDEAFKELTEYFTKIDDPTVIVLYGDHQPNIHDPFYPKIYGKKPSQQNKEERMGRFRTPVVVWANYDINPGGKYDEKYDEISINYLSAVVSDTIGLPMTAYQKFLTDLQDTLPVFTEHGYKDREGNIYDPADTDSPYYELVKEYNTYEYNYQFDKTGRVDDFFFLDTEDRSFYKAERK